MTCKPTLTHAEAVAKATEQTHNLLGFIAEQQPTARRALADDAAVDRLTDVLTPALVVLRKLPEERASELIAQLGSALICYGYNIRDKELTQP